MVLRQLQFRHNQRRLQRLLEMELRSLLQPPEGRRLASSRLSSSLASQASSLKDGLGCGAPSEGTERRSAPSGGGGSSRPWIGEDLEPQPPGPAASAARLEEGLAYEASASQSRGGVLQRQSLSSAPPAEQSGVQTRGTRPKEMRAPLLCCEGTRQSIPRLRVSDVAARGALQLSPRLLD